MFAGLDPLDAFGEAQHARKAQMVENLLPPALVGDHPGMPEDGQVPRKRRGCAPGDIRQVAGAHRAAAQRMHDGHPRRVPERLEHIGLPPKQAAVLRGGGDGAVLRHAGDISPFRERCNGKNQKNGVGVQVFFFFGRGRILRIGQASDTDWILKMPIFPGWLSMINLRVAQFAGGNDRE
jgi:hypothetical protein